MGGKRGKWWKEGEKVKKVEGRRKETKGKSGRKEEMGEVGKGTEVKENRCTGG